VGSRRSRTRLNALPEQNLELGWPGRPELRFLRAAHQLVLGAVKSPLVGHVGSGAGFALELLEIHCALCLACAADTGEWIRCGVVGVQPGHSGRGHLAGCVQHGFR